MSNFHTIDCACNRKQPKCRCDCSLGQNRRIQKMARNTLKRQRKAIAKKTGLNYKETLIDSTKLVL